MTHRSSDEKLPCAAISTPVRLPRNGSIRMQGSSGNDGAVTPLFIKGSDGKIQFQRETNL
jgi:hypothetical protein